MEGELEAVNGEENMRNRLSFRAIRRLNGILSAILIVYALANLSVNRLCAGANFSDITDIRRTLSDNHFHGLRSVASNQSQCGYRLYSAAMAFRWQGSN